MKNPPRVFILLLCVASCTFAAEDYYTAGARGKRYADWITYPVPDSNRPVWNESTKPLRKDDAWLTWREHAKQTPKRGRPLWKKIASSVAVWTDARDIKDLPSTASLSERIHNYEIAIGIKFTILF